MSTLLELDRISHAYGAQVIVNELSFELEKGEIGCLLGQAVAAKRLFCAVSPGSSRLYPVKYG